MPNMVALLQHQLSSNRQSKILSLWGDPSQVSCGPTI